MTLPTPAGGGIPGVPPPPPDFHQRARTSAKKTAMVGDFYSPEVDISQADIVAQLSPEEQAAVLDGVDMAALQYDFNFWGRPSQLAAVNSDAWMTVCLAGRGWGKSRVLSEAIDKYALKYPKARMLLLGRTAAEVRDVMINGESGIMNVVNPEHKPVWNQNLRTLTWPNGSFALCLSAEKPDSIRGSQFHAAFCDEIGSYRSAVGGSGLMNAFDQVKVATRIPDEYPLKIFVATTPRRVPIIQEIVEHAGREPDKVKLIRGSTMANRHLGAEYQANLAGMYAGTALGRQELDGELLTDVDGALLAVDVLEAYRREDLRQSEFWKKLPHRVVGIDPSVSANPNDECGIVVVSATSDKKMYKRHAFVLGDYSMQGSPDQWAREAVRVARKYGAIIVAEANQGGELVRMAIQGVDPHVPVALVHAKVGKVARAEPVGACYERGAVHHVDYFEALEGQLTSWAPNMGLGSPDRMDALVWAVTSLLITPPKGIIGRVSVSGNASGQTLPDTRGYDAHRAAEPRTPFGKEREDLERQIFGTEPMESPSLHDTEEANLPRRLPPSQRSISLGSGESFRARTDPFGAPVKRIR